jgi:hypothetical protein
VRAIGADLPARALDELLDLRLNAPTTGRGLTDTGTPPPAASLAATQCATVL